MTLEILAHRANLSGPRSANENSVADCRAALENGFGLEIDLRRDNSGRFYISHDPLPDAGANDLEAYRPLFQQYPEPTVAVNVKELGYEEELIRLQREATFGRSDFYFDFELLEKIPGGAQRKLASLPGGDSTRLASRLSDRGEPLAQCLGLATYAVWADEFDSLWLTGDEIAALRKAGRRIYAISPELHGFDAGARLRRWAQFADWGIDGLCTDYALEARNFFK